MNGNWGSEKERPLDESKRVEPFAVRVSALKSSDGTWGTFQSYFRSSSSQEIMVLRN